MSDIDDFFEQNARGGGDPSRATFDFKGQSEAGVGLAVQGIIEDIVMLPITDPDTGKKKFYEDGTPQRQWAITLQTDLRNWDGAKAPGKDAEGNPLPASEDTGKRSVYLRYQGARALVKAVIDSGATKDDLLKAAGREAKLRVERIENDGRMNQFDVKFAKGTKAPVTQGADDFFSDSAKQSEATSAPAASAPKDDEPPF